MPPTSPCEAVVAEQPDQDPVREPFRDRRVEAAEDDPRERREDPRVEQGGGHDREGEERDQRRVDDVDGGETEGEDEDSGDGREPGLEQDRADHEGCVGHAAGASQPDDPRERRPHASGDVLGEHRGHLRLERDAVPDADPEGGEQPPPADREEEVVHGQHRERRGEEDRIGVGEPRERVGPHVPEDVAEEREEDGDERELEPDDDTPAAEERWEPARHRLRV